ncbi:unnamed protein product, partial [Rotaria sp. Silwood1]
MLASTILSKSIIGDYAQCSVMIFLDKHPINNGLI